MSSGEAEIRFDVDWTAVGRRIRELRGFDTTQTEFAKEVGIGQSHLSAVERGDKELGVVPMFRIAQRYGKTIEWILTGQHAGQGCIQGIAIKCCA